MGLFFACYLAATLGWGVYMSCTKYRNIMKTALAMDAFYAVCVIAMGRYGVGVW